MPAVYAPGVAQVITSGVIGSQPWATSQYWDDAEVTDPWTQSALNALVAAVKAAWSGPWKGFYSSNVIVQSFVAVDLSSSVGLNAQDINNTIAGNKTTQLEPASLCVVMQQIIGARYRGGHPRVYLPWGAYDLMADESHWTTGQISAWQNGWATGITNVRNAMNTAGLTNARQVIPRYTYSYTADPAHHKYRKDKTGYVGAAGVTTYKVSPTVGSQRRRLTI